MPKATEGHVAPKQIVYLFGAGATQAEIDFLGARHINLLMRDTEQLEGLASRIIKKLPPKHQASFRSEMGTDIEKLISLLIASNVADYTQVADSIRRFYFEEIRDSLAEAKVLDSPHLAVALLTLHTNPQFSAHERLTGIITTNHDGLLQVAAQAVFKDVSIGMPFVSEALTPCPTERFPILSLHGCFAWSFDVPIRVAPLIPTAEYSGDAVWIPPGILKDSKSYPFNKLAGMSYEILAEHCDVLRVVGSSLTQNDWNVLSMIFNAQRHADITRGAPFRIELIMPHPNGEWLMNECSYLHNMIPIGFLTEGGFAEYKEDHPQLTDEMKNPFFYWLKEKVQFHLKRGDLGPSLESSLSKLIGDSL